MNLYRYDIYVGCNDKFTYNENQKLEKMILKISDVFSKKEIGFSITKQYGGYLHEDGTYALENSLKITLVADENEKNLKILINKLKEKYNQESVLVIKKKIEVTYNKEGEKINEI